MYYSEPKKAFADVTLSRASCCVLNSEHLGILEGFVIHRFCSKHFTFIRDFHSGRTKMILSLASLRLRFMKRGAESGTMRLSQLVASESQLRIERPAGFSEWKLKPRLHIVVLFKVTFTVCAS